MANEDVKESCTGKSAFTFQTCPNISVGVAPDIAVQERTTPIFSFRTQSAVVKERGKLPGIDLGAEVANKIQIGENSSKESHGRKKRARTS